MKKTLLTFGMLFFCLGGLMSPVSAGISEENDKIQKIRLQIEAVNSLLSEAKDLSAQGQSSWRRLKACADNFSPTCLFTAAGDLSALTSEVAGLAEIIDVLVNGGTIDIVKSDCANGTILCSGDGTIRGSIQTAKEELSAAFDGAIVVDTDIKTVILNFVNYLLGFLGLISVIVLTWAGFVYITSLGNDERVSTAKNIIIYTIVGLLVILFAYVIVNFFLNIGGDLTPAE